MPDFTVVQADLHNERHQSSFLYLLDMYAKDPMGGGVGLTIDVQKRLIKHLKNRNDFISLLLFDNESENAIGLLNAFEAYSTFQAQPLINIHDVYIEKTFRGTGAVDTLFDKITHLALEKKCCKLTLEVLSENSAAKICYRRLGFQGYELNADTGHALFWQKKLL